MPQHSLVLFLIYLSRLSNQDSARYDFSCSLLIQSMTWGPPASPLNPVTSSLLLSGGTCRHLTTPPDSSWSRFPGSTTRAVRLVIGPPFMCGDNPRIGRAFLRAAVFLRQCLHKITRRVPAPGEAASACPCTQCVCSSGGPRSIQRSRQSSGPGVTKGPRECLTHRRLSALNGPD